MTRPQKVPAKRCRPSLAAGERRRRPHQDMAELVSDLSYDEPVMEIEIMLVVQLLGRQLDAILGGEPES